MDLSKNTIREYKKHSRLQSFKVVAEINDKIDTFVTMSIVFEEVHFVVLLSIIISLQEGAAHLKVTITARVL